MAYVKTAVSIEQHTFESGEALARELRISRSDLYSRALRLLLRRRKMQWVQQQIDTAIAAVRDEQYGDEAGMTEALHHAASETMRRAIERGESTW